MINQLNWIINSDRHNRQCRRPWQSTITMHSPNAMVMGPAQTTTPTNLWRSIVSLSS